MSAPVRDRPVTTAANGTHHYIEPSARRRATPTTRYGYARGRSAIKSAAVATNLAEWADES